MSEPKKVDHWAFLATELGAAVPEPEISFESAPLAEETPVFEEIEPEIVPPAVVESHVEEPITAELHVEEPAAPVPAVVAPAVAKPVLPEVPAPPAPLVPEPVARKKPGRG